MKPNTTFTYLALGDSYTIGESVLPNENFPNQLTTLLRNEGYEVADPVIIAKTGWTTDELMDGIQKADLEKQFDLVTLLIGVNNQYRNRPVEEYKVELVALLRLAISFAGNKHEHVVMLSIPDWSVTPFADERKAKQIAAEINAFNEVNKAIAGSYQVHYIDITPGTRKAAKDHSLLAGDGLHPSGKEYKKWAEKLVAFIREWI